MCDIIHRRQYDFLLRIDTLFKFTNFAKQQEKLLATIHGLTSRVIKKRKAEFLAKGEISAAEKERRKEAELKKMIENAKSEKDSKDYSNMHYVRDDLDENDENDVGTIFKQLFLYQKNYLH